MVTNLVAVWILPKGATLTTPRPLNCSALFWSGLCRPSDDHPATSPSFPVALMSGCGDGRPAGTANEQQSPLRWRASLPDGALHYKSAIAFAFALIIGRLFHSLIHSLSFLYACLLTKIKVSERVSERKSSFGYLNSQSLSLT